MLLANSVRLAVAAAMLLLISQGPAQATTVATNWFSNQTSSSNVIDPPFPGQPLERLRLQGGFTSGFLEGIVLLPFLDTWTIDTNVFADENPGLDQNEFVRIFINGVEEAQLFNSPANAVHPFSTTVTGSQFSYRFEFESATTTEGLHLIVGVGTASIPMSEPGTLAVLGLGLAGLAAARRQRR